MMVKKNRWVSACQISSLLVCFMSSSKSSEAFVLAIPVILIQMLNVIASDTRPDDDSVLSNCAIDVLCTKNEDLILSLESHVWWVAFPQLSRVY